MEDILAITFIFGGGTLFLLAISPVGKAMAERIRGGGHHGPDPEVLAELETIRAELTEVQERLDFAERLLGEKRRDPAELPEGES
ncbi:MAG: hypothetical protein ACRENB_09415 [Gemmatimonadales bacterium]